MVLRFFLFAGAFLFLSCNTAERNNPDDPESSNYVGNRLSSSSPVKHSSSSEEAPLSSTTLSSSSLAQSSSSKPSSSSVSSSSLEITLTCSNLPSSVEKGGTIATPTLACSNGDTPSDETWTGRPVGGWVVSANTQSKSYTISVSAYCGSVRQTGVRCGTVEVVAPPPSSSSLAQSSSSAVVPLSSSMPSSSSSEALPEPAWSECNIPQYVGRNEPIDNLKFISIGNNNGRCGAITYKLNGTGSNVTTLNYTSNQIGTNQTLNITASTACSGTTLTKSCSKQVTVADYAKFTEAGADVILKPGKTVVEVGGVLLSKNMLFGCQARDASDSPNPFEGKTSFILDGKTVSTTDNQWWAGTAITSNRMLFESNNANVGSYRCQID